MSHYYASIEIRIKIDTDQKNTALGLLSRAVCNMDQDESKIRVTGNDIIALTKEDGSFKG